jgi:cystathionine gamma-synthase
MLFGSGMAAATSVILAVPPGSRIVASQVMYWAFRRWLMSEGPRFGYTIEFVDTTNLDAVRAALKPATALLYVETPGNPLWPISDIAPLAEIAHAAAAMLAIDSTCATPVFTQPLRLGADIVMHSASKYLNGHSDVIAGALASARASELWERIKSIRIQHGAILGPFEAWLLQRGLRTLDVRVRAQAASAAILAERLSTDPSVASVLYPGLPSHPGHTVAARQMSGFGAMLSIRLKGGAAAAIATAARVELWKRATSLGGVESLIEHRGSVEGPPCPTDLLRLSVGLEHPDDLFSDLDDAIRAAHGAAA